MAIEENKQVVLAWIQSGCNYEQGALLYSQFGKNKFLKKDFPRKEHKHATKIIYELCKSVGLDYAQLQREKLIPESAEKVEEKNPVKNSLRLLRAQGVSLRLMHQCLSFWYLSLSKISKAWK